MERVASTGVYGFYGESLASCVPPQVSAYGVEFSAWRSTMLWIIYSRIGAVDDA